MKVFQLLAAILLLWTTTQASIPMMDEDIGEAIFHNQTHYVIYVCEHQHEQILATFQEFCSSGVLCTILDGTVDMYGIVATFVGAKASQYLLILDSKNFEKYVLPIDQRITVAEMLEFQSSYHAGTLEKHYTSEDIPTKSNDPYLEKIVGLTFQNFIEGPSLLKVLFLYSDDEGCSTCKDVYDITVEAAKSFPSKSQVTFGSLDLFRNDHKLLNQQKIPVVLIYKGSQLFLRLETLQKIKTLNSILEQNVSQIRDL